MPIDNRSKWLEPDASKGSSAKLFGDTKANWPLDNPLESPGLKPGEGKVHPNKIIDSFRREFGGNAGDK